jgi:hypothetical protein
VRGYSVCSARRQKGPEACPSECSFPISSIDRVFLDAGARGAVAAFIDHVLDAAFADHVAPDRGAVLAERTRHGHGDHDLTAAIA